MVSSGTHRVRKHEQLSLQTYVTLPVVAQLMESNLGMDTGHSVTCKSNY